MLLNAASSCSKMSSISSIPAEKRNCVGEMPAGELDVSGFRGACVCLSDGGMIAFAPYRTFFSGGDLSIDVVLGRRNTFGPLHQTTLHPAYCAPDSFFTVGDAYTESYVLLPQGLLEKPRLF